MPPMLTAKKPKLSAPQIRILRVLSSLEAGTLGDDALAEEAKIQRKWVTTYVHRACKINRGPALWELGFASIVEADLDGRTERRYAITSAGRIALTEVDTLEAHRVKSPRRMKS